MGRLVAVFPFNGRKGDHPLSIQKSSLFSSFFGAFRGPAAWSNSSPFALCIVIRSILVSRRMARVELPSCLEVFL